MVERFEINFGRATLVGEQHGAGEALVFLHAGVADRRMWQPQLAGLSERYLNVAYDRRGFGETIPGEAAFSHMGDLGAVLDGLGIEEATLIGSSQGGRVAIDYALAYPQRVKGLVLIAPAVSGAPAVQTLPPAILALDKELEAAEEAGDIERINALEARAWLDGPTSPPGRVGGALRELFLDMNGIALRMPDLTLEIDSPSAYERVSALNVPALLLWGELDFPHVIERCRYLLEAIPSVRGEAIPGTAHLPNLEKPGVVNELIRSFLGEVFL